MRNRKQFRGEDKINNDGFRPEMYEISFSISEFYYEATKRGQQCQPFNFHKEKSLKTRSNLE